MQTELQRVSNGRHRLLAYGLRQTLSGRFSVVEVVNHRDEDIRGGERVILRHYNTHRGLPGSFAREDRAEEVAREKAQAAGVEFVGFRADSL